MRKKIILLGTMVVLAAFISAGHLKAQTVSDFEDLTLPADSYWNGADLSGFFSCGNASFINNFTDWGGGMTSWSGFSYSNKRDTITQSYTNEYSAVTAFGYGSSDNYAVCYVSAFDPLPRIRLNGMAMGDTVSGFYITNSAYAYLSMKNGGAPAKKFGGPNGTDPDWFAMAVYGYENGNKKADSVLFYLADYRFASSAQDYIVKDWQWVDLTVLGMVDSLEFNVFSSDTAGGYGINNPTYFCMDNLVTNHHSFAGIIENSTVSINVYPNPAENFITIEPYNDHMRIRLFDMKGNLMTDNNIQPKNVDIKDLPQGIYMMEIYDGSSLFYSKFIKK